MTGFTQWEECIRAIIAAKCIQLFLKNSANSKRYEKILPKEGKRDIKNDRNTVKPVLIGHSKIAKQRS